MGNKFQTREQCDFCSTMKACWKVDQERLQVYWQVLRYSSKLWQRPLPIVNVKCMHMANKYESQYFLLIHNWHYIQRVITLSSIWNDLYNPWPTCFPPSKSTSAKSMFFSSGPTHSWFWSPQSSSTSPIPSTLPYSFARSSSLTRPCLNDLHAKLYRSLHVFYSAPNGHWWTAGWLGTPVRLLFRRVPQKVHDCRDSNFFHELQFNQHWEGFDHHYGELVLNSKR